MSTLRDGADSQYQAGTDEVQDCSLIHRLRIIRRNERLDPFVDERRRRARHPTAKTNSPPRRGLMLNEQIATQVGPSNIDIAYERRGSLTDPVVLLVMGLAQLINWPEGFLAALVNRRLQ